MNIDTNVYCTLNIHLSLITSVNFSQYISSIEASMAKWTHKDMENKEHWKWSDAEKPEKLLLECWNSSGTFQL